MDSGNNSTSSLQSSSGADEDYDSRADSVSAFFNSHIFHAPIQRSSSSTSLLNPHRSQLNPADLGAMMNPTTSGAAAETGSGSRLVRNPKKRSRASRRAPTTVLTTDTTNFRAMVQEFTGIPAPPFTTRTGFDLSPNPNPNYYYYNLLRPFPHKPQPPHHHSFLSSLLLPAFPSTAVQNHNDVITTTNNSNFYNPLFNVDFSNSHHHHQLHLQAPQPEEGTLGIPPNSNPVKIGVLEELGLNHVHGGDRHNTTTTTTTANNNNVSGIQNIMVSTTSSGVVNNDVGDGGGETVRRVVSSSEQITFNGKANYSDFQGAEYCVAAARSEGMLESWINCSSD